MTKMFWKYQLKAGKSCYSCMYYDRNLTEIIIIFLHLKFILMKTTMKNAMIILEESDKYN